ncbi:TetR family transcriptional regulator [Streptomyces sp. MST-110588]|uniref:TetR/AcrR family transcriptional regulator n=1 Tax=Streptomyces sp. MST-110588 TaxID=2833628 RepID=UPI001F5DD297|nr:TetR family transcriptional regulator [Streptomyces sp. MST-110588]UNO42692.1 TetR family transcriptional regulator [Streptomyces sp. MST-110588]
MSDDEHERASGAYGTQGVRGEPEPEGLTLRQRKKFRTRRRISGVATQLFVERGFENVTVAEVARAAEVSTMTVFNYFPRKEDLFFDREPEMVELITRAVRERGPGHPPLAALRDLALDLLARRHPLGAVGEGFTHFCQVVVDSPALRARAREAVGEIEDLLAGLLAEAVGADARDHGPRLAAALVLAGCRTAYGTAVRRQFAGDSVEAVAADQAILLKETFAVLEPVVERVLPGAARPVADAGPEG